MNRKQADAAFESLRRHASAIPEPTDPADAAKLLDRAVLTQLQRDAIVHYISVGPDNLALAYSVLKAGAATFATACFLGLHARDEPAPAESEARPPQATTARAAARPAERALFAERMIPLVDEIDRAEPADRGARLVDAFTGHVAAARRRTAGESPSDRVERPISDPVREAGDLLEAAGIAYLIAQLLESPTRPAAAVTR
jgi:hypothetical protein